MMTAHSGMFCIQVINGSITLEGSRTRQDQVDQEQTEKHYQENL